MYVYLKDIEGSKQINEKEAKDFVNKNYKENPKMKEYVIVELNREGACAMPYEKEGFERLTNDDRPKSFHIISYDDAIKMVVSNEIDTFKKIIKRYNDNSSDMGMF